jgi:hypothetical protein
MSTSIAVGATVAIIGITYEILQTIKRAVDAAGRLDDDR